MKIGSLNSKERAWFHSVNWLKDFWRKSKISLITLLVLVVLAPKLQHYSWFYRLDLAFLDMFVRAQSAKPSGVYVVEIDDEAYRDYFKGRSPLPPVSVLELIKAVKNLNPPPYVIGVDLDTRDDIWKKEVWDNAKIVHDYDDELRSPKIVWAAVPDNLEELDNKQGDVLMVGCPLGGDVRSDFAHDPSRMGLVVVPEDEDGVVRRYRLSFPEAKLSCAASGTFAIDAFEIAVAKQCDRIADCRKALCKGGTCGIEALLKRAQEYNNPLPIVARGAGSPPPEVAGQFLECAGKNEKRPCALKTVPVPQEHEIVLIGGNYSQQDQHVTPAGAMPGVELFANGIIAVANNYYLWERDSRPFDFVIGLAFIVLAHLFSESFPGTIIVNIVGVIVPPLFVLFAGEKGLWLEAAPVLVSLVVAKTVDGCLLRWDLKEAKKELAHDHAPAVAPLDRETEEKTSHGKANAGHAKKRSSKRRLKPGSS
jgi:CHASE2 domain-containing sensor protein